LILSAFSRSLEAITQSVGESLETVLEKASTEIQAVMNEEISSRMVGNGT